MVHSGLLIVRVDDWEKIACRNGREGELMQGLAVAPHTPLPGPTWAVCVVIGAQTWSAHIRVGVDINSIKLRFVGSFVV
jgi:hypothetical protein